jgi:hypothetical protein
MKVVINRCFGGFSLSPQAVKRLAELEDKPCYFFLGGFNENYKPISLEVLDKYSFWCAFTIPDPNTLRRDDLSARWEELHLDQRPENRADPNLVEVVEELGDDANGAHAKLRIVEVPDNTEWEIDEYEGMETIHERHRIWY